MTQALEATTNTKHYVHVAQVADVKASGYLVVYAEGQAIANTGVSPRFLS